MGIIFRAEGIVKRFGDLVANDHIDFDVEDGSIHCLLGENGAGKTTLINVLYGLYQVDEGKLYIDNRETRFHSPADALKEGIGMVSQQFSLVPRLTVTENVVMGDIPIGRFFAIDKKAARDKVLHLAKECGFHIDVDAKVEDIATGEQQRVEIIKALYRGAKILILDEATASLTSQEVDELFKILRSMTSQGRAVIFITHKLDEALRCDQITVLRAGKVALNTAADSVNQDGLCSAMFCGEVCVQERKDKIAEGSPVALEVKDLHARSHRRLSELKGVSFNIHAGEIFGVAGIAGNGQSELVQVITGLREATQGSVVLSGVNLTNCSTMACRKQKVAHISENTRKTASFGDLAIFENLISGSEQKPPFAKGFRLDFPVIKDFAKKMVSIFDIRALSINTLAKQLSGGNLQKMVLARELDWGPNLIVAAGPTRGLDVKTAEVVHQRLLEQRGEGKAILLVSHDLNELLALADRIAVMYEGGITILPPDKCSKKRIERLMVGLYDKDRSVGDVKAGNTA